MIEIGDVVLSTKGRDKNGLFLVIDVVGKYAYIVDGRTRKTKSAKKKNVKHLERVFIAGDKPLAENIKECKPVSDLKVRKSINALIEKV